MLLGTGPRSFQHGRGLIRFVNRLDRCISPMCICFRVLQWLVAATLAHAIWLPTAIAQERPAGQPATFGATYGELTDEQRLLLDGFFRRAGAILKVTIDPQQRYDSAPLSSRSTFSAVTHALLGSTLTDRRSGQSMGRTIDIIDYVEGVRGQVKGAPGDEQFRVYVALKPGARELVDNAKEFRRTADNTFFHQGYPISYRQDGHPSIQISMALDASRADIDVDYRSSRFPLALVNGHLSAANSDVRAGNHDRHNARWTGLANWWDGFMGSLFTAGVEVPEDAPQAFPAAPRAGSNTIDVAVDDFLTSWLVESRPNLAVSYVDAAAYDCLAQRLEEEGQALDRGLASLQLFARMRRINDVVGPRKSLAGTTRPRRLSDPALRVVDHKRMDQYSIYGVPRALAERMSCAGYTSFGKLPSAPGTRRRGEVYENFYSTVAIDRPDRAGAALGLLWQRRDGVWKIVSYQALWEDAADAVTMPELMKPAPPVAGARATAEPSLLQANERFLDAWLVRKTYDGAAAAIAPEAYACINLYLDQGERPMTGVAEQSARLMRSLERVSDQVGAAVKLEELIESVEPTDPRLRVVEQPRISAFHVLGVPDWMGPTLTCEARLSRGDMAATDEGADRDYGSYYISALRFLNKGEPGAVLILGWRREADAWRIFSFKVIEP
jgi:hypothetical protein